MHILKTYLINCSFHGVPYTVDRRFHWTERLFWFGMVIISGVASVYLMYSSYEQFRTGGISFTVDTSYLNWKSYFPALMFCEKENTKYQIYAEKLFGKKGPEKVNEFYTLLKDIVYFGSGFTGSSLSCAQNAYANGFPKLNFTEYTDKIRSSCKEIFGYCAVDSREFQCCDNIVPIDTVYGRCYALNSIASKVKPKKRLHLHVAHKKGLDVLTVTIELLTSNVKVLVLSRDAVPRYIDDSNTVMDGNSADQHYNDQIITYLAIQEIKNEDSIRDTTIERRNCKFPEENNLVTSSIYSLSSCIVDCLLKIQMKRCNCNHHLMPGVVKNEKLCDLEGLLCLTVAFEKMMEDTLKCDCYSSCSYTEIRIIGGESTKNYTKSGLGMEFHNQNTISQLEFVLNAPTVRFVRSLVNGNLDLVVSLGGTAGLCFGASVLTIVEFFYYFIVRPCGDYQIEKNKRRKKILRTKKIIAKPPYPFRL